MSCCLVLSFYENNTICQGDMLRESWVLCLHVTTTECSYSRLELTSSTFFSFTLSFPLLPTVSLISKIFSQTLDQNFTYNLDDEYSYTLWVSDDVINTRIILMQSTFVPSICNVTFYPVTAFSLNVFFLTRFHGRSPITRRAFLNRHWRGVVYVWHISTLVIVIAARGRSCNNSQESS